MGEERREITKVRNESVQGIGTEVPRRKNEYPPEYSKCLISEEVSERTSTTEKAGVFADGERVQP